MLHTPCHSPPYRLDPAVDRPVHITGPLDNDHTALRDEADGDRDFRVAVFCRRSDPHGHTANRPAKPTEGETDASFEIRPERIHCVNIDDPSFELHCRLRPLTLS
jgi:hypothetical protein